MVRLTTHYDKSIKKKVYQVRGDESYAHTTDVSLANSTILDGRMKGFKTDLTATIYRGMGASTVLFYDGEEVIGQEHISNGTSTVTLSDVYLSWIYPHELYVRYLGNDSCLSSRSKKLSLQRELPDDLKIIITDDTATHQYNTGATIPISATLTVDGEAITTNVDVKVYVDSTLKDTITSSDEVVSGELTGISDGKHTIRLVVEDSSSINGNTLSYDIKVGYKVDILSYSSPYIVGGTNSATVQVLGYDDTSVSGGTVTIGSDSGTTNSNGVATISLTSYSTTLTASCNGSTSSSKTNTSFTPSDITASGEDNVTAISGYEIITISVNGTGTKSNIPINISVNDTTTETIYTDDTGTASSKYYGVGDGDVSYTVSIKGTNVSTTITIEDLSAWYIPRRSYNTYWSSRTSNVTTTFTKYSNYRRLKVVRNSPYTSVTGVISFDDTGLENSTTPYMISVKIPDNHSSQLQIGAGIMYLTTIPVSAYSEGDEISAECSLTSTIIKINGEVYSTKTHSKTTIGLPIIGLYRQPSSGTISSASIDFSEIKVKKLS